MSSLFKMIAIANLISYIDFTICLKGIIASDKKM